MSGAEPRISTPDLGKLNAQQEEALASVMGGPRGALFGPFGPLLHVPGLMSRIEGLGAYLRFESSLPPATLEMAVLLVARKWKQQFEWQHHAPLATDAGVSGDTLEAIRVGARPKEMDDLGILVWEFVTSLLESGRVNARIYGETESRLGTEGILELSATVGYYTTLAWIMNAIETPADGPMVEFGE